MSILTRIKFFIKRVRVSNYAKFSMGANSGVGTNSIIQFSCDNGNAGDQRISIGNYSGVGRNCELHVWDNNKIVIKDHSTLNDGCKMLGDVTIERYCLLSANIFASSGNHYAFEYPTMLIKDQDKKVLSTEKGRKAHSRPIHIEEDCWIGYGVFIKQGISIGRGAVIGSNSVVLEDVPPYSVQGGIPAKEIRKRIDFDPPEQISALNDAHLPYFYRGFEHKQEQLELSRKKDGINSTKESAIILKAHKDVKAIRIKGNSTPGTEIIISLQGKYEWRLKVKDQDFDETLEVDGASQVNKQHLLFYNTFSEGVRSYNLVCFTSQVLFGITNISIS